MIELTTQQNKSIIVSAAKAKSIINQQNSRHEITIAKMALSTCHHVKGWGLDWDYGKERDAFKVFAENSGIEYKELMCWIDAVRHVYIHLPAIHKKTTTHDELEAVINKIGYNQPATDVKKAFRDVVKSRGNEVVNHQASFKKYIDRVVYNGINADFSGFSKMQLREFAIDLESILDGINKELNK